MVQEQKKSFIGTFHTDNFDVYYGSSLILFRLKSSRPNKTPPTWLQLPKPKIPSINETKMFGGSNFNTFNKTFIEKLRLLAKLKGS